MNAKEKILLKLKYLQKYTEFLNKYKDIVKNKLEEDYILKSAIERNLQLALESVIDISEVIISEENLRKPEEYKETITLLVELKILTDKFAKKFAPAMGLRNILVHQYTKIDINKLHKHLKEDLEDFNTFAKAIIKYLEKNKKNNK